MPETVYYMFVTGFLEEHVSRSYTPNKIVLLQIVPICRCIILRCYLNTSLAIRNLVTTRIIRFAQRKVMRAREEFDISRLTTVVRESSSDLADRRRRSFAFSFRLFAEVTYVSGKHVPAVWRSFV